MYSSKCFNYNYMEFVAYKTCDKLRFISNKGCRNKKTIIKPFIPKSDINKTCSSSIFIFGCSPHTDTCDILSEAFPPRIIQAYSSKKRKYLLRYVHNMKYIHAIGLPTTIG